MSKINMPNSAYIKTIFTKELFLAMNKKKIREISIIKGAAVGTSVSNLIDLAKWKQ